MSRMSMLPLSFLPTFKKMIPSKGRSSKRWQG